MKLKLSRYNIFQPLDEGLTLAYNSGRGSFVVMEDSDYDLLIAGGDFAQIPSHLRVALLYGGFLVRENLDELAMHRVSSMIERSSRSRLSLTLAPTTNCKFKCIYCYEEGVDDTCMAPDVVDAIYNYVDLHTGEGSTVRGVSLNWFGGEPLLYPDIVIGLTKRVAELCAEKEVHMSGGMITNGTLLTEELLDEMLGLGLSNYQITVDGPPDVHNNRRPYKTGRASFDDVIRGVRLFQGKEQGRCAIRINVDRTNVHILEDTLKFFVDEDLGWCPMGLGQTLSTPQCSGYDTNVCFTTPDYVPVLAEFHRLQRKYGFTNVSIPSPRPTACGVDNLSTITIGPRGETYKCWNDIGRLELSDGHIAFPSSLEEPNLLRWLSWDATIDPNCSECSHLPICMGGCPAKPTLGLTTIEGHDCNTERYLLNELLKYHFLNNVERSKAGAGDSQ